MAVKDTQAMIAGMTPVLAPGDWVFCTVALTDPVPPDAFALIREDEGATLILPRPATMAAHQPHSPVMQRITLEVHSDLEGVGLTAAVATALAARNIPCNVVAGYHHDHIFVPKDQAALALSTLHDVQKAAK